MEYLKLCDSDYRFMMVVWEHAPVSSGTLVKLCNEVLGWKKSTTYTTIKKLSEKGYIKNENAIVSVLIEKERVQREESAYFVERTFWWVSSTVSGGFSWWKENSSKGSRED